MLANLETRIKCKEIEAENSTGMATVIQQAK